jgi:hypothetical protein
MKYIVRRWFRSAALLSTGIGAAVLMAAAPPAHAAHATYCNVLVGSSYSWAGSPCYSTSFGWFYSSATYSGSGNIDYLRTGLQYVDLEATDVTYGGKTVNVCSNRGDTGARGRLAQFENSGAQHTIQGYVDNSPNHSDC